MLKGDVDFCKVGITNYRGGMGVSSKNRLSLIGCCVHGCLEIIGEIFYGPIKAIRDNRIFDRSGVSSCLVATLPLHACPSVIPARF
jgi:hypothetical protein